MRQAAEWERGTKGHGNGRGGAQSVASRTRRRGGRDGRRVGLHDGGDGGARGRARRSRRRGGGRRVRRPPLHLRRRAPPRAQVQVYAIFCSSTRARGTRPREKNANGSFTGGGGLSSRVVDVLIERLTDPHHPPAGRLASAAYLASFLARAAFLSPAFLAETLRRLAKWCLATAEPPRRAAASSASRDTGARDGSGTLARAGSDLRSRSRARAAAVRPTPAVGAAPASGAGARMRKNLWRRGDDSEEYANASAATLAVFDSACQALMYVLCYRMEDVLRFGGNPPRSFGGCRCADTCWRLQPRTRACRP